MKKFASQEIRRFVSEPPVFGQLADPFSLPVLFSIILLFVFILSISIIADKLHIFSAAIVGLLLFILLLKNGRIGIYIIFTYILIDIFLAPSLSFFEAPGFCLYEGGPRIYYGEVLSIVAILCYLLHRMMNKNTYILRVPGTVKVCIVLLLAFAIISFFLGIENKTDAPFHIIRNVLALSIIFPFVLFFNYKIKLEGFIKYIFFIATIYIILAIISIFKGEIINILGGDYCVILILSVLLCIAFSKFIPRKRGLLYALAFLGAFTIFIIGQIQAIISFIFAMSCYYYFKSSFKRISLTKLIIIMFFILFFIWGANLVISLNKSGDISSFPFISSQDVDAGAVRMAMWESSLTEIIHNPFFGKGAGGDFTYYHPILRNYRTFCYPHNLFIWLGLNMGLLAPILVMILLLKIFCFGIKTYKNVEDPFFKNISLVFLSNIVGIIGAAIFSDIFTFWRVNVVFMLSVGVVFIIGDLKNRGEIR